MKVMNAVAVLALLSYATPALAENAIGVTATEIKVGGIFPYAGPASALGLIGRNITAYVQQINDRGGVNGRKVNYISYECLQSA